MLFKYLLKRSSWRAKWLNQEILLIQAITGPSETFHNWDHVFFKFLCASFLTFCSERKRGGNCLARPRCTKPLRDVCAWLRLRFCCSNSCSPARSPFARKPLLSHIFIGSLSALDYRVREEVTATCISSCSRCIYRIRNVGVRELGIWNIGCETNCKMFVFVRGWESRPKKKKAKQTQNSVQKSSTKLYWCYIQLWDTSEKKKSGMILFFRLLCSVVYDSRHLETVWVVERQHIFVVIHVELGYNNISAFF